MWDHSFPLSMPDRILFAQSGISDQEILLNQCQICWSFSIVFLRVHKDMPSKSCLLLFFAVALRPFSFLRFLDHTQRPTTVGRTPLDEWSARRRDLYLTTHNIHNRQISMPAVKFEPTISAGERLLSYALKSAASGTGSCINVFFKNLMYQSSVGFSGWFRLKGHSRKTFVSSCL
jgi:hypothetical protein